MTHWADLANYHAVKAETGDTVEVYRSGGDRLDGILVCCEVAPVQAMEFALWYPPNHFAAQVLSILLLGDEALEKWHGSMLTARIAGLGQRYADAHSPVPSSLGQSLLRILDILIDQGDRRSAALELTEAFGG